MKAVRLPKKPDSVVNALRDAILSGAIEPGAELNQVELAESLGVSRMPVREALIVLEYQGLAVRLANQRVRVADIDRAFLDGVFSLGAELERQVLEARRAEVPEPVDELDFHRTLYALARDAFRRRILETVTESYVAYGVRCPGYDASAGLSALRRGAWKEYFERLADAIMKERRE